MKAVRIHAYGSYEALKYEEAPIPELSPTQVLVKVHAVSVNHLEVGIASGKMNEFMPIEFPWTPGFDFAGVVEEVGDAVAGFLPEDKVYSRCNGGSYAEYILVESNDLVRKPDHLTFAEAATVPHTGLTAWQALYKHGHLKPHQKVLIHGGAGAVGSFAVQFARESGAYVIATAGTDDLRYLESLKPDEVIDYKKEDFTEKVKEVDLVIDLVGGETQKRSYQVLKKNGRLVSTTGLEEIRDDDKKNSTAMAMVVETSAEDLKEITCLIESYKITCDIATTYPLQDAKTAWETYMHQNPDAPLYTHGKIVLQNLLV